MYGLLSGYRDWIAKRPSFWKSDGGLSLFVEFELGKKGYFASTNPMSVPLSLNGSHGVQDTMSINLSAM